MVRLISRSCGVAYTDISEAVRELSIQRVEEQMLEQLGSRLGGAEPETQAFQSAVPSSSMHALPVPPSRTSMYARKAVDGLQSLLSKPVASG
jgi:hypothetical protein